MMCKYQKPKADITFKCILYNHPDLVMNLKKKK